MAQTNNPRAHGTWDGTAGGAGEAWQPSTVGTTQGSYSTDQYLVFGESSLLFSAELGVLKLLLVLLSSKPTVLSNVHLKNAA